MGALFFVFVGELPSCFGVSLKCIKHDFRIANLFK